jgi:hypothetical protein
MSPVEIETIEVVGGMDGMVLLLIQMWMKKLA